jgi:carbamoyltransferase
MDRQLYQYHPVIGYHFIPNLKVRLEHEGGGYLVRVNSAGFRSEHEFEEQKARDKFRILLFGDSFTAGEAVSNKHRYGDLLETLIPGVEVYNFALPGTGTDQHYLSFREFARAYEHDLVVIGVQVENIRRVAARHRLSQTAEGEFTLLAKPYFEMAADGTLTLRNVPVPRAPIKPEDLPEAERAFVDQGGRMLWLRQLIGKMGGRVKEIAQQVSHYQPLPEYEHAQGREWLLMKAILRQWTGEITKPVIIMPIPLYHYIEETASADGFRARFAELKEWPGVTVHDVMPDYYPIPLAERRGFRFEKDIHPTPSHHRFLAGSLAKVVRQKLDITAGAVAR